MPLETSSNAKAATKVPRGCLSVFLLFFLLTGATVAWGLARTTWQTAAVLRWPKVDAEILEARVTPATNGTSGNVLELRYRYQFAGHDYSSSQYERGVAHVTEEGRIYKLAAQLAPPTHVTAFVNPEKPNEAVLHRSIPWGGLGILLPLLFVAVGVVGLYFTWRRGPVGAISTGATIRRVSKNSARLAVGIVSFLFFCSGAGMSFSFFFRPLMEVKAAKNWPAVPCEVVSSQVHEHPGSKGATYSVDVVYRYQVNNRTFTSARYAFSDYSSSGRADKAEIVAQFPAGARKVCYVNPADPTDAVINRDASAMIFVGVVPLMFAVVGLIGVSYAIFGRFKKPYRAATIGGQSVDWIKLPPEVPSGELTLASTRMGKLFGTLLFALVWNSLTLIAAWQFISKWRMGIHSWGLGLFLVPFMAVGLLTLGYAGRVVLVQFNPRVRLKSNSATAPLGGSLLVNWTLDGRVDGLRNLRITLEGREEATYQSGKNTRTDRSTFLVQEIFTTTEPLAMRTGSARVAIPSHTMHSFNADRNQVVWSLRVSGKIPRWPDIDDEFFIAVLPAATTS